MRPLLRYDFLEELYGDQKTKESDEVSRYEQILGSQRDIVIELKDVSI